MNIKEALVELRKEDKRKFQQSVDLIINLRGIDPKRDNISAVVGMPNKIKEKKICGFFNKKSNIIDTITPAEFVSYKDKKSLKNLVKKYDFFVAQASLMPSVATAFGKALGPAGKMPSPQLGILMQDDENQLKNMVERIGKSVKIRVNQASIKIIVLK